MNPEQIAEGRRLLAEATAGPWVQGRYGDGSMRAIVYASGDRSGERVCTIAEMCEDGGELADASAIVWLRNHAAELLDAAGRADDSEAQRHNDQAFFAAKEDSLTRRAENAERERDAALAEAKAIRDQLQVELEGAKVELARRDHCHVCGDVLVRPDDARCEAHVGMDPGDLDGEECACAYCVAGKEAK